jgi:hypothetical protein
MNGKTKNNTGVIKCSKGKTCEQNTGQKTAQMHRHRQFVTFECDTLQQP